MVHRPGRLPFLMGVAPQISIAASKGPVEDRDGLHYRVAVTSFRGLRPTSADRPGALDLLDLLSGPGLLPALGHEEA